jgi:4a-hydroxytetrahydrobiopterin dehydratase
MSTMLAQEKCVPCHGGMPPLDLAGITALLPEVPGWHLAAAPSRIERDWTFQDFATALAFVNRVGEVAEAAGHHPDIAFGWGYVKVSLHTHAIGGLHRTDFIVAARIDGVAEG